MTGPEPQSRTFCTNCPSLDRSAKSASVVVSVTASSFSSACVVCWPSVEWWRVVLGRRSERRRTVREGRRLRRRQVRACRWQESGDTGAAAFEGAWLDRWKGMCEGGEVGWSAWWSGRGRGGWIVTWSVGWIVTDLSQEVLQNVLVMPSDANLRQPRKRGCILLVAPSPTVRDQSNSFLC